MHGLNTIVYMNRDKSEDTRDRKEVHSLKDFDERDFTFERGYCPKCHSRDVWMDSEVYSTARYYFDEERSDYVYDHTTDSDENGSGSYYCHHCDNTEDF